MPHLRSEPRRMSQVDFTCRPEILDVELMDVEAGEIVETDDWLEVGCVHDGEMWRCGHHHRRLGPLLRCMTRHVVGVITTERSEEGSGVASRLGVPSADS